MDITLVITGSIAAYKSIELMRNLQKSGAKVYPVMSRSAAEMINPILLSGLNDGIVYEDSLEYSYKKNPMLHIELARKDVILVCPATANIINKAANGVSDTLCSTILLTTKSKVVFVPAMNATMWENEVTQKSVKALKARGAEFLSPTFDKLACGEVGFGKMQNIKEIEDFITKQLAKLKPLTGKTAVITAGATREPIDNVRFISNFSSGKQGLAVAKELIKQGAKVFVVCGSGCVSLFLESKKALDENICVQEVETGRQMNDAVHSTLQKEPVDIFVSTAAVCDFYPVNFRDCKVKKSEGLNWVEYEKNPDILKSVCSLKEKGRPKVIAAFSAETTDDLNVYTEKMRNKGCDIMFINNVSGGAVFGKEETSGVMLVDQSSESATKQQRFDGALKSEVAEVLIKEVTKRL